MDEPLKGSKGYQKPNEDENKYSVKNYVRCGNIHGLQYLGREKKCETCFFATILLISLSSAVIFIWFSMLSQSTSVRSLPPQPIYNLPFPAITICPETKAQKSMINFTDVYMIYQSGQAEDRFRREEISYLEALSQVCDPHLLQNLNLTTEPTLGAEFTEVLREIAVNDSILYCKYRGKVEECTNFLKETITDDGVCSTFNMIPSMEMFASDGFGTASWSPNLGYESEAYDVHPRRAFSGSEFGFNVVLNQKSFNLDFLCRGPVQGWKVKIHSPDEHPRMATGFQRIPLNSETSIVVKPEVTLKAGKLGPTCHSTESKSLKYFKEYSQANCMTECLSEFVLSQCECVKFSMIHDGKTEICNQHKTKCVADAEENFATVNRFKEEFSCDCKPSCSRVKYSSKVYQADFQFKKVFVAYNEDLDKEFPSSLMSRLVVYIEDDFYVPTYLGSESPVDLVAKIGGILAFFLGASWISFIEVFCYFLRRFTR